MPVTRTSWKAGERPEGAGRPVGGRNKRTTEIVQQIIAAGHQDPLLTLAELQAKSSDEGIRATAANMLAPYLHSKMGVAPVPPDPVYMDLALNLPRPKTIEQATDNIALLTEYKSTGKLDIATADSLINDQRIILNGLVDQAKLLVAQGGPPEQVIRIEGGMPVAPGHEGIIMPPINGVELQADPVLPASNPKPDHPDPHPTNQEP